MVTKHRIQKLESWLPRERADYTLTAEKIEVLKKSLGHGYRGVQAASDDNYQLMRNTLLKKMVENMTANDKEKTYTQFDNFFFKVITKDERGDLLMEMFSGDLLPNDYEFVFANRLIAYLQEVCYDNNVDPPKS